MSRLDGKKILITGGASGIGLAATRRFVAEGATVYVLGRRLDALEEIRSELGDKVTIIQGDVTKSEDLDRAFSVIQKETDKLDVLFANAGVGQVVPLGEIKPEEFDYTFGINVRGTLFTVQRMLPLLGSGSSVILTGSTAGSMGTAAMSVYNASKAAVRSLARSWAQDLRGTGIASMFSARVLPTQTSSKSCSIPKFAPLWSALPLLKNWETLKRSLRWRPFWPLTRVAL